MNYRERFETFGQFLQAVAAASRDDQFDPKLTFSAAATGLSEGVGSLGGFAVPDDFLDRVWSKVLQHPLLSRVTRIPCTSDRLLLPAVDETSRQTGSRFGGVRGYWVDEAAVGTATKPKFQQLTLAMRKLRVDAVTTNELLEDAAALEAVFELIFVQEVAHLIEAAIISGTGVGQPLGILNSGAVIQVSGESGQAAATIRGSNVSAMCGRAFPSALQNGVFMCGTEAFQQLVDGHLAGGASLLTVDGSGQRRLVGALLILSENLPALGETGDLMLVDPSAYVLAEREQAFLSSVHLHFDTDEMAFKARFRLDGKPLWRTPVTPAHGSSTQSAFVALAAR